MDYQKTLNLPQTDFSMRAGLVNKEPVMLTQWAKEGLYELIRKNSEGKPRFTLHDGPPYANGNIHIGHTLNKIIKDIIVKQKTMLGFDSKYIPGWDCHGLPIEHKLLQELKANKEDVEVVEFRKKAHDYAMKYVGIQREQFERLGIYGEWDKPYLTLNPDYEYWILKSLAELTKKGYIYRQLKPVNWCFNCQTALAEAEVEHEDHTSPTVFVRFPINNPNALGISEKLSLVVWTTTPWTLLANVAVAARGNYTYVIVKVNDELLIIEKTLSTSVLAKAGIENFEIVKEVKGEDLIQLTYTHPFAKKENCPVVLADYVTNEDGTGLVHTAPGHGQDDYVTGLKNKLDILMPVNHKGVFDADGAPFEGEHVFKANPKIIEDLKSRGLLLHTEEIHHSYPHCWRCKKPVIFRATHQWFLKIDHDGLRTKLKEVIQRDVKWFPAAGQERIEAMVALRPDWCLSRQRHWGVPIPSVRHKETQEEYLFPELIEYLANIVKQEGSDAWFKKELADLWPVDFKPNEGEAEDFEKSDDILDVWFDSGVSHQAVMRTMLGLEPPADLYVEGSDQHRGWFQSSLIPSVALDGRAPYKQVLTHGFVVDAGGRKMSKSLGNVISPEKILKQNGADLLRLWVLSCNYHDDIRLSNEILERITDGYRKMRNTMRYMLGNLHGFTPQNQCVVYKDLLLIDRWALNRLSEMLAEVTQAFEIYDFPKVYRVIYHFCNERMSGIYLDILKDRLYTSAAQSSERLSAQTVLYYISDTLVRLLAPILAFTAEEMFMHMPKTDEASKISSVHLLSWPEANAQWLDSTVDEQLSLLMEFRPFVLKSLEDARAEGSIGSSLDAKVILRTASDRDADYFESMHSDLPAMFIASQVEIHRVDKIDKGCGETFAQTSIEVVKADGDKCPRCWNYKTDIGENSDHPTICLRCAEAVKSL